MAMRRRWAGAVAALCIAWHGGVLAAPPDAAPDPITTLLVERGLLSPAAGEAMRQWRDHASELVLAALNFVGTPYRLGGNLPEEGFDCSGFTRYVFGLSLGLPLPRRADEQAQAPGLRPVDRQELQPGDLVFFNTLRRSFSHVGIYIGDSKFVHAPRRGAEIRVEDMRGSYWATRFNGARRPADDAAMGVAAPAGQR